MAKSKAHKPIIDIMPAATKKQAWRDWRRAADNRNPLLIIAVAILVLAVGFLFYNQHRHANNAKGLSGQSQINDTVNKVSKLILLPSGEQPTLAIVNDASKYSGTPFFKNAANGDRLLVYAQAHEAILYRPSINKIIAVAPLSVNSQPSSSSVGQ
jgi:hypothetical protein